MKDKISVSIGTDHSYDCKADVIGRAGEGNVTQMEFKIPSKLCSCSLYLDFEKPNGETYRTPKLPIKDGVATYNVQPFVLTDSGEIKVQAVFEKASGEIWKSEIKMYANHKSINVTEDIDGYIVPSGTLYIRENGTWDCSSYATVEVAVLSYSVKGIVELDPVALRRSSDNIEQSINFQLYEEDMDGDPYSKIRFSDGNLTYIKSDGTEHTVFKYSNGTTWISGDYSGDPSKLNFGDYAEVVSAEFYLWLKSVEKQQGGSGSTATLIEKTFTANDTYNASDYGADGFSSVTVDVESGGEALNLGGIDNIIPTKEGLTLLPSQYNLDGFDEVVIEPIPDEYVIPSGTLDITENGIRSLKKADGGYYDSVNVDVPSVEPTLKTQEITENGTYIANDYNADGFSSVTVNVESSGGGAELNIAYGDTAPEDTSKLWVKTSKPSKVKVSSAVEYRETDEGGAETLSTKLPIATYGIGCASVGTKIYLFGGHTTAKTDAIYCFDTETEEITTLSTKLPSETSNMGCASVGTKIYLFGGNSSSTTLTTINCFDTETEKITTLTVQLPIKTSNMGCASVGTKIYLFGGSTLINYTSGKTDAIYCFDTETEEITTLSTKLPSETSNMGCASVGTKIYLFGGHTTAKTDAIYCFDTETEEITTLSTKLPSATNGISCASDGTKIYLFGGFATARLDTINCFDTETEEITTLSTKLPIATFGMGYASVGTKIYLFGGGGGSDVTDIIVCFTAWGVSLAENVLQIFPHISDNVFQLINTNTAQVEIGVNKVYKGNADGIGEQVEASLHNGTTWVTI